MWTVIFYLAVNAFCLVYFWRKKKVLTPYEIAGCWLVTIIFGDDWLTITSNNLNLIETTKDVPLGLIFTLNRIVFFRIVAVMYLDTYVRQRSIGQKVFVFVLWTLTFLLIQQLSIRLGLLWNTGWKSWWSLILWSLQNLLLIGLRHVFVRLYTQAKEGR